MKKHELLKHAYDNYPKGTKYKQHPYSEIINIASGNYEINDVSVYDVEEDLALFIYSDKFAVWAQIVKPKIAVKVENEKEFKALMKYCDSLGYDSQNGHNLEYQHKYGKNEIIAFHTHFFANPTPSENYQIIPFSGFASEHNIKLPLLTSEDGVDLYEGDKYILVGIIKDNWIILSFSAILKDYAKVIRESKNYKSFFDKQAALDWIEAQKPKEIRINIGDRDIKAIVTEKANNYISFERHGSRISITHLTYDEYEDLRKSLITT